MADGKNDSDAVTGAFTNGNMIEVMYGGRKYLVRLTYDGADGNDVVATIVPSGTFILIR